MNANRNGLTWVEALVVLLILGFTIVLLLPVSGRAREAARRSACANNLKQLVLAVHNYHDAHNHLVPVAAGGEGSMSWMVLLMPYMEQQRAYNSILKQAEASGGSWTLQGGTDNPLSGHSTSLLVAPRAAVPCSARILPPAFCARLPIMLPAIPRPFVGRWIRLRIEERWPTDRWSFPRSPARAVRLP